VHSLVCNKLSESIMHGATIKMKLLYLLNSLNGLLYPEHTSAQNYEILYSQWNMKPEFQFSHYSQHASCNNVKMFVKTEGVRKVLTFEILRYIHIEALPCCRSKHKTNLQQCLQWRTSRLIAKFPNNLMAKCRLSFVSKAGPYK
jgi:hypothetical protein